MNILSPIRLIIRDKITFYLLDEQEDILYQLKDPCRHRQLFQEGALHKIEIDEDELVFITTLSTLRDQKTKIYITKL